MERPVKSSRWTTTDIPDQTGKTIVVTGANSGLGEQTARALAARGAHVILACRDIRKGEMAAKSMNGHITVAELDLADLASVRRFAEGIEHVDVLVNNAGIMAVPEGRTSDGFESQFGTNFLGHFALTGLLLPRITERVVTLSSLAHRMGTIRLDDPNWKRRTYQRWPAYGQSKLADLMFAYELHRRLAALGSPVRSIAAHPGFSKTELHTHTDAVQGAMIAAVTQLTGQSSAMGALPSLFAATAPDAAAGGYYGPGGPGEVRGYPRPSASSHRSRDPLLAVGLW
ncbi:MAG: family NAD(P)-dependent oxidoreductase, partial [Microbacteriaceae bacterium]|nr:family NAD(P)-dependent oxidoreductase [Microbacteriaceae bacterium]